MNLEPVPVPALSARVPPLVARGRGLAFRATVLILAARRIETIVRRSDKVACIGGDEFVVLLDTLNSVSVARGIAGKLVDSLALPFSVLGGVRVSIGARVGVVYTHYPPEQIGELLRHTDAAMYEARNGGKSRYPIAFPA